MTQSTQHPTIFLQEWNDALGQLHDALSRFPRAKTITFAASENSAHPQAITKLRKALEPEMVVAAEFLPLNTKSLNLLADKDLIQPVASITGPISVFKVSSLAIYVGAITKELNGMGSPEDISVFMNRLGFSSVAVAVSTSDIELPSSPKHNLPRDWDAYIKHVRNDWTTFELPAAIHFDEVLGEPRAPKVLIDATDMPPTMNGTSRNVISFLIFLENELAHLKIDWEVTAVIPRDARGLLPVKHKHISFVDSFNDVHELFDLGISVTPITSIHRCLTMNKICLRWVVEHLDIIAVRSLPFLSQQTQSRRATELYLKYADEVIFISSTALQDACEYFSFTTNTLAPSKTILLGAPLLAKEHQVSAAHAEYFVVLGNDHPHKQVDLAIKALIDAGLKVTSLSSSAPQGPLHSAIAPGTLSDEQMSELIERSTAVVFPSLYEGFGLPLAEAAALGKQVILWDTQVSREVSAALGTQTVNFYCRTTQDIVDAAREISMNPSQVPLGIRSIDHFNEELIQSMNKLLSSPVDKTRLNARWDLFNLLDAVSEQSKTETVWAISRQHWRHKLAKLLRKNLR